MAERSQNQIIDEPIAKSANGKTAQLEWYPVVPGTVKLRFGPTTIHDDAFGHFHWHSKRFASIAYGTGVIEFDKPIMSDTPILAAYQFDPDAKPKPVEMKITSTPIKAKVTKLEWKSKRPSGPDPIDPKLYFVHNGANYNDDGVRCSGSVSIPVLEFLWGRRFDQVVMGYVHGLRPSAVRVSNDGGTCCDCRRWRVTIYTDPSRRWVESIKQEIEVNLPKGVQHGQALQLAKEHGINSPQVKWHLDSVSYAYVCGKYYKTTKAGKHVPWKFKSKRNKKLWRTPKKKS